MADSFSKIVADPIGCAARGIWTPRCDLTPDSGRRRLLRQGAALGAACLLGGSVTDVLAHHKKRSIRLLNDHTGERIDLVYWVNGTYIDENMAQVNHLLRDHRANSSHPIDPRLIDTLFHLQSTFEVSEPLHVLSGYRTPATNAALRRRSKGVAKYSLHMEGRAVDIYLPGVKTRDLQQAALAMHNGGVGYYRSSGFIHVDTGRVRHWERG